MKISENLSWSYILVFEASGHLIFDVQRNWNLVHLPKEFNFVMELVALCNSCKTLHARHKNIARSAILLLFHHFFFVSRRERDGAEQSFG